MAQGRGGGVHFLPAVSKKGNSRHGRQDKNGDAIRATDENGAVLVDELSFTRSQLREPPDSKLKAF